MVTGSEKGGVQGKGEVDSQDFKREATQAGTWGAESRRVVVYPHVCGIVMRYAFEAIFLLTTYASSRSSRADLHILHLVTTFSVTQVTFNILVQTIGVDLPLLNPTPRQHCLIEV